MIEVRRLGDTDPLQFLVTVREQSGETSHRVSMAQSTYQKWTSGRVTPEQCVEAAFAFLLEREPKESILTSFDITVISRYFPDFEASLPDYLQPG